MGQHHREAAQPARHRPRCDDPLRKDLTDLTQEESCAEVYTGVYPYWVDSDGNVTQITGNPVVNVPDGQYNFVRVLTLDVSQDIKERPPPRSYGRPRWIISPQTKWACRR